MAAKATTTLKLPRALKARIAKKAGTTSHGFMVAALERQTAREERTEDFVKEALAADREIDAGSEVYAAPDVHAWLDRLALGDKPTRPRPLLA